MLNEETMTCINCNWCVQDKCINDLSVYRNYIVNNLMLCPYWDKKIESKENKNI